MQNNFLDELKNIKLKLSTNEAEEKRVEEKKEREERLRNEFAHYMRNAGVKKKS